MIIVFCFSATMETSSEWTATFKLNILSDVSNVIRLFHKSGLDFNVISMKEIKHPISQDVSNNGLDCRINELRHSISQEIPSRQIVERVLWNDCCHFGFYQNIHYLNQFASSNNYMLWIFEWYSVYDIYGIHCRPKYWSVCVFSLVSLTCVKILTLSSCINMLKCELSVTSVLTCKCVCFLTL